MVQHQVQQGKLLLTVKHGRSILKDKVHQSLSLLQAMEIFLFRLSQITVSMELQQKQLLLTAVQVPLQVQILLTSLTSQILAVQTHLQTQDQHKEEWATVFISISILHQLPLAQNLSIRHIQLLHLAILFLELTAP